MGTRIGFRSSAPVIGDGNKISLIDWTHQPFDRGVNPKPTAIDSEIVTVQILPRIKGSFTAPEGIAIPDGWEYIAYFTDVVAYINWSAAKSADLEAEIDLQVGSAFSVVATEIKVSVSARLTSYITNGDINVDVPVTDGPKIVFDATLGRGGKSGSDHSPIRTRRFGVIEAGVKADPVTIPPFSSSLRVVTSTAPPNFTVRVNQRSGSRIVQVDDVTSSGDRVIVNAVADNVTLDNLSASAFDLSVPFRIALPG